MILTLYKNCFLKDTYAEVFDPSVLERYLDRLESEFIEIDASYPTLNGSIQLDFTLLDSPFEFNYMKLEADDRTYYCFINAIDLIGHNLARVSYQMDIWSTYIGGMKMRNSVLGSTKYLMDNFGFLPINYDTSKPLKTLFTLNDASLLNKVGIIIEFQTYTLTSSDEPQEADRQSHVAALTVSDWNLTPGMAGGQVVDTPATAAYRLGEVEEMIQCLIAKAAYAKLYVYAENFMDIPTDPKPYYEIINIYIMPAEWVQKISTQYAMSPTFSLSVEVENEPGVLVPTIGTRIKEVEFWTFTKPLPDVKDGYTYPDAQWKDFLTVELPNWYTNIAVGPYTNPIPLSNNGLTKEIVLRSSIDGFNFNLTMNMDGQIYDITPFYNVEVPFTSANAETIQLRRIADREKRNNAIAKITGSIIGFGGDITKQVGGMSAGTPESVIIKGVGSAVSSAGGLVTDIWTGVNAIQAASAAKYQTTYSQNVDVVGAVNAFYGMTLFRLGQPYNEAEVEYAIDNVGYTTAIIVPNTRNPWNPLELTPYVGYNPTRYHYINLYGEAPQNIVRQLEGILTRGTKIHYA